MMAFTTLIIAVPLVAILYFALFTRIKWDWISYLIVTAAGIGWFFTQSVHGAYIGAEIIIIGWFWIWMARKLKNSEQSSIEDSDTY